VTTVGLIVVFAVVINVNIGRGRFAPVAWPAGEFLRASTMPAIW
jgi:hypothetical protein